MLPLHKAVEKDELEIVELLASHWTGEEAMSTRDIYSWTPLHWAADRGHVRVEVARCLIAKEPKGLETVVIKDLPHHHAQSLE